MISTRWSKIDEKSSFHPFLIQVAKGTLGDNFVQNGSITQGDPVKVALIKSELAAN